MPKFSQRSKERLNTCHPLLVRLMNSVIEEIDITILCGHRGQHEQDFAFSQGHSKLKWPKSKHNSSPSMAVDIAPYPIDWKDLERFKDTALIVKGHWERIPLAERMGFKLQWGGDWKNFVDMPHWELKK